MEWKSNLRRSQSLRSVSSSWDKPTWTEARLQDRKASVSQLAARYQSTVEVSTSTQPTSVNNGKAKPKQVFKETTPSLLKSKDTHLECLMRRNDETVRSRAKTNLSRSKSMGSLQNSSGSIDALKALFESKAAAQNKVKSHFRAANSTSAFKAAHMPAINAEAEEVQRANTAEDAKSQVSADSDVVDAKTNAKEDHVTRKVVNHVGRERRKTIGGIDFEKIAASQTDEKRRSIADFRDSSFIYDKEKLCVSVKDISALYLSKVAPQKTNHRLLKLVQDQSSESGKRGKLTKMDEESQQRRDDLPPPPSATHQPGPEVVLGAHSQQSTPRQLSKEQLHHQRQKCELRRLLKHTHPEVKMLDEVVDEELADVLSSESGVTAGETGYEGEVLSRCLIFEKCALSNKISAYTPKMHMTEGKVERGNGSKTSAVFEGHEEKPPSESVEGMVGGDKTFPSSSDSNREYEEEMIRADVHATRRIFESQSVNTPRPSPDNKFKGKVSLSGEETGAVQKQKQEFEMSGTDNLHSKNKSRGTDLTEWPHKQVSHVHVVGESTGPEFSDMEKVSTVETVFEDDPTNLSAADGFEEIIKTSDLFKNNPFISTNIERENSYVHTSASQIQAKPSGEAEDYLITNVKNRAHLFESMPFDRIRHQNKDEVETMVENIKETLNSLYNVNAIHSEGSIIEVNETMIAKKAKFILSDSGPKIKYDEVAEGGAQNFILQLIPRANLKPQITYLKEDSQGLLEATVVNVPLHHHQFTTSQDTQFKTANIVQLVEDILNQDNSLRKGVIFQEDVANCAEIIVYSLYNYFDEEDVKGYRCPQSHAAEDDNPETERNSTSKTGKKGVREGIIKSTINCVTETSQDQACPGSIRPEVTVKGNVKLFKSCIEKGDLEYLKTLQAVPTGQEQEVPPNQTVAGQGTELLHEQRGDPSEQSAVPEWAPVDIRRLKSMFSGDQRQTQTKHKIKENCATISHGFTCQNVPVGKSQCSSECKIGVFSHRQEKNTLREEGTSSKAPQLHLETQDKDMVHQAELVKAVADDNEEICKLHSAINSLQQATDEAKSLSPHEKHQFFDQVSCEEPIVSMTVSNVKHFEAELPQRNEDQKVYSFTEGRDELPLTSNLTLKHKSNQQHENTEMYSGDTNTEEVQTTETLSNMEVVQKNSAMVDCSETAPVQQLEEEVVFQGKRQAALESLERLNVNVIRGDFKAAMIYRNSSKPLKERSQNVDVASVQESTVEGLCAANEPKSTETLLRQEKEEVTVTNADCQIQRDPLNKPAVPEKNKRSVGPKPAIPPKPEHLKVKQTDNQSANTRYPEATKTNTVRPELKRQLNKETAPQRPPTKSVSYEDEHMKDPSKINTGGHYEDEVLPQESQVRYQVQGISMTLESDNMDKNTLNQPEAKNGTAEENRSKDFPVKENIIETDGSHVDCEKFGAKKAFSVKNAPVKPKRVKIAQPYVFTHGDPKPQQTVTGPLCNNTNTCGQTADSKDRQEKEMKQESKVEMREKKGRTETEDERRQRLSVHMDEIMRGNITAAMEIFDNLRKQEELQSILSRVEEIEQDTSEVDVKSLRKVYENIPEWVVSMDKKREKTVRVEHREEKSPLLKDNTETKSSMAHVFGDLERASEEIMNLKEQTLARLMDIEEAIKKALYSVSTLKSDSDIAGLSCLFKESLGTAQESPSSSNISKISIGSSRTKSQEPQESLSSKRNVGQSAGHGTSDKVVSAKQRASPPSSPAFISIQSAAKKRPPEICPTCQQNPHTEEKFTTTKTLTCNSPAQNSERDPRRGGQKQSTSSLLGLKQEISTLEVQTDSEGKSIIGTKTVTENYERTDNFGNRLYSTKTSTVISTQPEIMPPSTGQTAVLPATYQVTTYPDVQLPVNQKP